MCRNRCLARLGPFLASVVWLMMAAAFIAGALWPRPGAAQATAPATTAGASAPILFYSDIESGPSQGGEKDRGAFVSLFGQGFGATQGQGSVTIGGGSAAAYPIWSDRRITLQLGSATRTGDIVVHLAPTGPASNSLPFAVRPGRIFFVSATGDDHADGSFKSPWKTLVKAKNTMAAGDITYAMDGVSQTTEDQYKAALSIKTDGAFDRPIALVAYPGATVTVGVPKGLDFGLRIPNVDVSAHFWVISGLTLRGGQAAIALGGNGARGWRIIANDMSCPGGDGPAACVETSYATYLKFLGNDVHDISIDNAATVSKLYHAIYFSTDSNHIEAAWNHIHHSRANRAIQFHSTPLDKFCGFNQYDLLVHDNIIHDIRGDAINFATVDPAQGPVKAYNNLIYHVGLGPDFRESSSSYAGVYVAGITNRGQDGKGNVEVYDNTFYDCGARGGGDAGALSRGEGSLQIMLVARNNIIVAVGKEAYVAASSSPRLISGSHNLLFGQGIPPESWRDSSNVDPLFVDPAAGDFRLQRASPAHGWGGR